MKTTAISFESPRGNGPAAVFLAAAVAMAAVFAAPGSLLAQNNNSGDRPAVPRPDLSDEKIRATIEKARDVLDKEGKDLDDSVRAAQDRFRKRSGESSTPTTITDRNAGNSGPAVAPTPAPAPARATAAPTSSGSRTALGLAAKPLASAEPSPNRPDTTPRPLIPEPAASSKPPAPAPAPPPPAPTPLKANPGSVPPPVPLRPRYEKTQSNTQTGQVMEITAQESIMNEKRNMATFIGDVVVNHPTFVMESEHLEVFMNDKENPQLGPDGKEPPFKNAIATGPMVEIEQVVIENGKKVVQIAKARRADFDGITGDTILTGGPPFLQKGKQVIRPKDDSARIVLKSNGEHRVEGRNTVIFQVKGGKGAGNIGPGLGGNLDSLTKRENR